MNLVQADSCKYIVSLYQVHTFDVRPTVLCVGLLVSAVHLSWMPQN